MNWKGGITEHNGYDLIWIDGMYQRVHRLIYEFYHKCSLLSWAVIHHIDGDKHNNWIWNLKAIYSQAKHMSLHFKKDMSNRMCHICNSNKTYTTKKGYEYWRIYNKQLTCYKCYSNTPERRLYLAKYYRHNIGVLTV